MKKILSLLFFAAIAVFANAQTLKFGGKVEEGNLVFTYENTTGKTIANCNFQIILPEGISIQKNSKGKFVYTKGDATEDMSNFDIKYNEKNGKYTIAIYNGEFDDEQDNIIVKLPLEGELKGEANVVNIAFGDPDEKDFEVEYGIAFPDFTIDLATAINGISAEETKSGVIYNLNGQRVSKATKGVFVIDGKKVAVNK